MDRSVAFYLIAERTEQDSLGQFIGTQVKRLVYGQISSVSSTEFFSGGQNGLTPEWRIDMFAPDYEDEEKAEVNGVVYTIYRHYWRRNDVLELYLERRRGDDET